MQTFLLQTPDRVEYDRPAVCSYLPLARWLLQTRQNVLWRPTAPVPRSGPRSFLARSALLRHSSGKSEENHWSLTLKTAEIRPRKSQKRSKTIDDFVLKNTLLLPHMSTKIYFAQINKTAVGFYPLSCAKRWCNPSRISVISSAVTGFRS